MSVFVAIVKGEYDAELKWPFTGKVQYTLLNQVKDDEHHTVTQTFDITAGAHVGVYWGLRNFIPHTKLALDSVLNMQYLKDDTMYFRVSVEAINHKPWLECTTKDADHSLSASVHCV